MAFNNLFFLFVFLPVAILLYYLCPKKAKSGILALISLLFFAWGSPEYLLIIILSILFNYCAAIEMDLVRSSGNAALGKFLFVTGILGNVFLLGYFKYRAFLLSIISGVTGLNLQASSLPMPLGLSFFTFSAISYLADVYMEEVWPQKNLIDFTVYIACFAKVTSGPIVLYRDMERSLTRRKVNLAGLGEGVLQFSVGLMKKVLIADRMGASYAAVMGLEHRSTGTAILGILFYGFQLYFDFSGYSDMAIGLGRMLGFKWDKNFDHPFMSKSISEFWRRWHISLGAWFRTYIYIPLGGNRCGTAAQIRNLLAVWLLTGLWHGASFTYITWGLFHGLIIIFERFVLGEKADRIPQALRILVTFFLVSIAWPMFFGNTFGGAFAYYRELFGGAGLGFLDTTAKYYLRENAILLIISIIGSTPLVEMLYNRLSYGRSSGRNWLDNLRTGVSVAAVGLGLIACVAGLVSATYSSFLYFQF